VSKRKRTPKTKRREQQLQIARDECGGDITLDEALDRVRNPRKDKWSKNTSIEVFLGVESLIAAGLKVGEAHKAFAKYSMIYTSSQVDHIHRKGRLVVGVKNFEMYGPEIIKLHLEGIPNAPEIRDRKGNPALKKLCEAIKKERRVRSATRTPI
jgi:hypothetical protein